jgi:hypothetical protein
MNNLSSVPLFGDLVPKKPRNINLGFDRPLSKFKFAILSMLTHQVLVRCYKSVLRIITNLVNFFEDRIEHKASLTQLQVMSTEAALDPKEFGYTGDVFTRELEFIHKYALQLKSAEYGKATESLTLYARLLTDLEKVLSSGEITTVLNFGIGYAYIDSLLANQFPNVNFVGIERTPVARWYNREFGLTQPSNLEILDGDIIKHLENNRYKNGLLLHIRTATLLPKGFMRDLYKCAYLSGFTQIYGAEQCGISRRTGEPFEFSYTDKPSELYRRHMFIHNYPALLNESGFNLPEIQFIKTDHPHFDYRILTFLAKKRM